MTRVKQVSWKQLVLVPFYRGAVVFTENLKLTQQFGLDTFLLLETGKGVVVCRNPLAPTCSPWEISDQAIESIEAFTDVPVARYGRSVTGDGTHGSSRPLLSRSGCISEKYINQTYYIGSRPLLSRSGCI